MIKLLLVLSGCLCLTACYARDDVYYLRNPAQLQSAMQQCQFEQSQDAACQNFNRLSGEFNRLANELRLSPQGFGLSILSLQQEMAQDKEKLSKQPTDKNLVAAIAVKQRDLAYRLAIV